MELAIFLLFAALALGSAVVVVAHRDPVKSTMSLVVTLVSLAALFVLLGAPFIAALQVLIYTGAIVVLFLFVIMLLNLGQEEKGLGGRGQKIAAGLGSLIFAGMVLAFYWRGYRGLGIGPLDEDLVSLRTLAAGLFDTYLLTFELVGLLLLVAVIAATVVARRPPAEGGR
jgi:NADH-quinone oxidoreductase subunit J